MFSRRADWDASVNRLTRAREERHRRGEELLDLTVSNPTRVGLTYPHEELAEAMAQATKASYDPQPLGLPKARDAVAAYLGCDGADIVITASTSESYSFLFKLLTNPGDAVLTPRPSYPLLEHLTQLELIELHSFPLELHRRWEIASIDVPARTRAIVAVSPNNPTGSYVTAEELDRLASKRCPLIVDEVFREYSFSDVPPSAARDDVLTFALGGLSKSAGLPHYKLGWIRVSGPHREKAIAALELIADDFLSVATPVQEALPSLLQIGARIRNAIQGRTVENLRHLREALPKSATLLPVEGGWSAVIRVPQTQSDEELALSLLDRGVLVQPGYFYDFDREGYLVVSLLTQPDAFREGVRRIANSF
jgi:alanine-synthesizing transaminase